MMISYENEDSKFQYRAASIMLQHNKVLLQRPINDQVWFIPGGRVEFHETAEQAIEREMIEEFAIPIFDKELVWIIENFITFPEQKVHEIGLFFLVTLPNDHPIYLQKSDFEGAEEGYVNKWVCMDELDQYNVVPEFVVPELRILDSSKGIKHIINRGVRGI